MEKLTYNLWTHTIWLYNNNNNNIIINNVQIWNDSWCALAEMAFAWSTTKADWAVPLKTQDQKLLVLLQAQAFWQLLAWFAFHSLWLFADSCRTFACSKLMSDYLPLTCAIFCFDSDVHAKFHEFLSMLRASKASETLKQV